jgi:hypothetical protein
MLALPPASHLHIQLFFDVDKTSQASSTAVLISDSNLLQCVPRTNRNATSGSPPCPHLRYGALYFSSTSHTSHFDSPITRITPSSINVLLGHRPVSVSEPGRHAVMYHQSHLVGIGANLYNAPAPSPSYFTQCILS